MKFGHKFGQKLGYIVGSAVLLSMLGCGNAQYLGASTTYIYAPVNPSSYSQSSQPNSSQSYHIYSPSTNGAASSEASAYVSNVSNPANHLEPKEPTVSYEYDYGDATSSYIGQTYTPTYKAETPKVETYSAETYQPAETYSAPEVVRPAPRVYDNLTEEGVVDEYFEYVYGDEDLKGI